MDCESDFSRDGWASESGVLLSSWQNDRINEFHEGPIDQLIWRRSYSAASWHFSVQERTDVSEYAYQKVTFNWETEIQRDRGSGMFDITEHVQARIGISKKKLE